MLPSEGFVAPAPADELLISTGIKPAPPSTATAVDALGGLTQCRMVHSIAIPECDTRWIGRTVIFVGSRKRGAQSAALRVTWSAARSRPFRFAPTRWSGRARTTSTMRPKSRDQKKRRRCPRIEEQQARPGTGVLRECFQGSMTEKCCCQVDQERGRCPTRHFIGFHRQHRQIVRTKC